MINLNMCFENWNIYLVELNFTEEDEDRTAKHKKLGTERYMQY